MHAGPKESRRLSAAKAVLLGHLAINVPVLMITASGALGGAALGYGYLGFVVGVVPAWVFWSFAVPRWRRWALRRGAPPERLQSLAAATGLVWRKGSILEKTEASLRDDEP